MADNNFNIIKPVESLQNIGGLAPVKQRKERKHKQNLQEENQQEENQQENQKQPNESGEEDINIDIMDDESDQHSVDYCA